MIPGADDQAPLWGIRRTNAGLLWDKRATAESAFNPSAKGWARAGPGGRLSLYQG
jgi:hypothetical protein